MPVAPISQIRKLTHREIEELAQGHSVNECPNQEDDSRAEVPKFCWTSALPPKAQCPGCTLTGRMRVRGQQPRIPRDSVWDSFEACVIRTQRAWCLPGSSDVASREVRFCHVLEKCVVVVSHPHRAVYTQMSAKGPQLGGAGQRGLVWSSSHDCMSWFP